jgi:hypothetical protein
MIDKLIKKIKERKIKKFIEASIIILFVISFLLGAIANIKILLS